MINFSPLVDKLLDTNLRDIFIKIRQNLESSDTEVQTLEERVAALEWWNNSPRARAAHSVNQSIANATGTILAFDQTVFDNYGMHNLGANTKLTIKLTGYYLVGASVTWDVNVTGYRNLLIQRNGTTLQTNTAYGAPPTIGQAAETLIFNHFTAGDYLEVLVAQSSGGALNVITATAYSPRFWALMVGKD